MSTTPEIAGYREWADEHYPIGPGWNSATDILLRQAWIASWRRAQKTTNPLTKPIRWNKTELLR